jgi:hypothetical protein
MIQVDEWRLRRYALKDHDLEGRPRPRRSLGKYYPAGSAKARMEAASRPMKSKKVWTRRLRVDRLRSEKVRKKAEPTEAESQRIKVRGDLEEGRVDRG